MEFLTVALQFGKDLIAGNYITAAVLVAPFILPNKVVHGVGYAFGRFCSKVLRQKAGKKSGEQVESWFQGSLNALVSGVNEGMDEDDEQ